MVLRGNISRFNRIGRLFLPKKTNVICVFQDIETLEKKIVRCRNIVTNSGDIYYATAPTSVSPSNYNSLYLGDTGAPSITKADNFTSISLIAGSEKALYVDLPSYPKVSDPDPDNTGSGVDITSFKFEYDAVDGDLIGITEGIISTAGASGTDTILCHFSFGGSFNKDSSTILKVYVNHESLGV